MTGSVVQMDIKGLSLPGFTLGYGLSAAQPKQGRSSPHNESMSGSHCSRRFLDSGTS